MKRLGLANLTAAVCMMVMAGHAAFAAISGPVKTDDGMVQGSVDGDLAVFKGIPFAAPPVGDLRFKPPAPVQKWSGIKKTTAFAPACMQNSAANPRLGLPALTVSEDCLYLNIWTPATSPNEKLPVMVWIYGGGFTAGTTSYDLYNGANLAKKGVIVVSIAYRVGPFGFLTYRGLDAEFAHHVSGNYGLMDQIAGLKWVKDNIAAFGGDPNRVTIFGESAGGISVSMLAASPLARGLFEGAISESGGSFGPTLSNVSGANVQPLADAEKKGEAFAKKLGAMSVSDLRKVSAEEIHKADGGQLGGWWPVLDGYVITGDQYKLYLRGQYNDVPVLIGTNSDEGSLFVFNTTADKFKKSVEKDYGPFAESLLKLYPATNDAVALQSARDLTRDTTFGWSTWAWAQLQAKTGKSKVFMYYFNHKPPKATSKGASHGSEMAYVFQNFTPGLMYTKSDHEISDAMATYWTNFAKTGDPNGKGVPQWPQFTGSYPKVMHFNDKPEAGGVANLPQLQGVDAYMAWRRKQEQPIP